MGLRVPLLPPPQGMTGVNKSGTLTLPDSHDGTEP